MERGEGRTRRGEGGIVPGSGEREAGRGGAGAGRRSAWPARSRSGGSTSAASRSARSPQGLPRSARAASAARDPRPQRRGAVRPAPATRPVAQRRPVPSRPAGAVRRPGPAPGSTAVGRLPHPRLTGLGSGLFCGAAMLLLGFLDSALSGSLGLYSVLFLPVCVLTALWVREGDLLTAPVVVPNAFALGLLPAADHGGGLGGHLMGLVTALATEAGWLYGGTLLAGVVVLVRRVRLVARRAAIRGRAD
ncbi:DUF6542 domain-containing protein [Streptomyces sp. NPDC004562]|uniref:DUF6542 domain-containing protein n=1 Tax=Streptomyces sp. NPDC004562 TaxID=3364703 RepID=UPI00368C7D68